MSIDVDIIPSCSQLPTWGDIRQRLLADDLTIEGRRLLGPEPRLHKYGSHTQVEPTERLDPEGHYYFGLADNNTLSLHVHPITDDTEARDFVEDFARNLGSEDKEVWISAWERSGFKYQVGSFGGRHEFELFLFVNLVAVVCELAAGIVMVTEEGWFGVHVGLYPAAEFRKSGYEWWRRYLNERRRTSPCT